MLIDNFTVYKLEEKGLKKSCSKILTDTVYKGDI